LEQSLLVLGERHGVLLWDVPRMRWWIRFSRIGTPTASRKPSGESDGGASAVAADATTTTATTDVDH
ncbi:MAG TPA: hypothetical protein VFS29_12075, partial [Motilibacteraceae bacterium]|nr:hypothetical protein [Motilibacteraceae bacterium]